MFQKYFYNITNLKNGLHAKPNTFYNLDLLKNCSLKTSTYITKPQKLSY